MDGITARAVLSQNEDNPLSITVTVANGLGMAVSAARVVVTDPAGNALLLPFVNDKQAYAQSVYGAIGGTYRIGVSIENGKDAVQIQVPYAPVSALPEIVSLSDASGASALSGQSLSSAQDIALAWEGGEEIIVYVVNVMRNGNTEYSARSETPNILIPSSSLRAGIHSVRIEAQSIQGDPLLAEENFYAVSSRQGSSVAFSVE